MQISELVLKTGGRDGEPLRLPLGPSITVFVGPNNSGKSLLLREISHFCFQGRGGSILDRLLFPAVDEETASADLDRMTAPLRDNERLEPGNRRVSGIEGYADVNESLYVAGRLRPNEQPHFYTQLYGRHFIRFMNGETRLNLVGGHALGDLKRPQGILTRISRMNH